MTSYAIRFEEDGCEEILCPEADRQKCETPEEVAAVRARHKKISKMDGCFCLDCYRFSGEKLQVRLAAGPKVSFYYAHLPGADKDKHTKAERSHGGQRRCCVA